METNYNLILNFFLKKANVVKVTRYISPTLIVRATRKMYSKQMPPKSKNMEITVTIGRPNFVERAFIKKCKKAGEPFPIKKAQLKLYTYPNRE